MIPILSSEQVREADAYTILTEPVSSIDLMERACIAFTEYFSEIFPTELSITIVCGPGNNGGDGLGIARLLSQIGYATKVYVFSSEQYSQDFKINLDRLDEFVKAEKIPTTGINSFNSDIIIDAIFGSGLNREATGLYKLVIDQINESESTIAAVDMPSGLQADGSSSGSIIHSNSTLTFQFPKISLLLPQNYRFVGDWDILDIGLMLKPTKEAITDHFLVESWDLSDLFQDRNTFSHKGDFGHSLIAGGSFGKMGAVVLSSRAALKSGLGLLTSYIPSVGYEIMQTSLPEAMVLVDTTGVNTLNSFNESVNFDSIGIGPGLGVSKESKNFLVTLLKSKPLRLVLDADAINLISKNKELLDLLPENSILTPHPGEFKRLVGIWEDDFQKLEMLKSFCASHKVITVLKGANTVTCSPSGKMYFNSTGNPGMATAGSGDVLTGIVTALLARSIDPVFAAVAGVYIHGLAGDFAATDIGEESLIASDIINNLPQAFTMMSDLNKNI